MSVKGIAYSKPLPVALFCGVGKPDFSELLSNMAAEFKAIEGRHYT
jgi:hypothetical protein